MEQSFTQDNATIGITLPNDISENTKPSGVYVVQAYAYDTETQVVGDKLWETEAVANNAVVIQGRNDMLDKYLSGSGYTATWYTSLIDVTNFSSISLFDTASYHAGWQEYQSYSESTRPAIAWSNAASGTKAFSANVVFTIPSSANIAGLFITSSATKGGTGGVLYSAGAFTEGNRVINGAAILNVGYSTTLS